jgi:hypothetical protein
MNLGDRAQNLLVVQIVTYLLRFSTAELRSVLEIVRSIADRSVGKN